METKFNIGKLRDDIRAAHPNKSDRAIALDIASKYSISASAIRAIMWREADASLNPRVGTLIYMCNYVGKSLNDYIEAV